MNKKQYQKRLQQHSRSFEKIWTKITKDTNNYVDAGNNDSDSREVENLVDDLCLSGAWIKDRIEGKSGNPHSDKYRGSLSKKIRKVLGYSL